MKPLLQIAALGDTDIVLDFFAGSCPLAQAVLELNREGDCKRTFIMVQFPEPTEDGSPARGEGFNSIADIGKERIRRVIAQMRAEDEGKLDLNPDEDLGFKVFRLAPSTFRHWQPPAGDAEALARQLTYFDRGLEEGADPQHVLYEVILKEGYSLNSQIEELPLESNRVYRITDGVQIVDVPYFYLCLNSEVHTATLDVLPLDKDTVFICLDAALTDSQKVNLAKQCLLKVI